MNSKNLKIVHILKSVEMDNIYKKVDQFNVTSALKILNVKVDIYLYIQIKGYLKKLHFIYNLYINNKNIILNLVLEILDKLI